MSDQIHDLVSLKTGGTVIFGSYDWTVLDIQSGQALLISKDIVEKSAYNTNEDITWEKCSLRAYLNGEFFNKFSDCEKQLILDTEVVNNDNPEYGTEGGNDTVDKIFLLSIGEVSKYFSSDAERIADYKGSAHWWWLRSPGIKNHAAFVYNDGFINVHGYRVDYIYSGIRPAMYIRCPQLAASEPDEVLRPIASLLSKSEKAQQKLKVGTWQHTMLQNNIKALRIASALMGGGMESANSFPQQDLQEALEALSSMIEKSEKAQAKFAPGTSQHTLQKNRIKALKVAAGLVGKRLDEFNHINDC